MRKHERQNENDNSWCEKLRKLIEHNSVLCKLGNVLGILDLLTARYSRRGACQGIAALGVCVAH